MSFDLACETQPDKIDAGLEEDSQEMDSRDGRSVGHEFRYRTALHIPHPRRKQQGCNLRYRDDFEKSRKFQIKAFPRHPL